MKITTDTLRLLLLLLAFAAGEALRAEGPDLSVGLEVLPSYVPGTNTYLRGDNPYEKHINHSLTGAVNLAFRYAPDSRQGMLYPGLYQGLGVASTTYFASRLLGTPVSAYLFQGAPIVHLGRRVWLGYEWKFGIAFGWEHEDYPANINGVVSTSLTAHMGLGAKVHYELSDRWEVVGGFEATHYSNGHTSWPNGGVNALGVSIGAVYRLNKPAGRVAASEELVREADRGRWMVDIAAYGAWRTRVVYVGDPETTVLCPGKFPVAGLTGAMMRKLNRFVSVGPALDLQWDQSAGLAPYWAEGLDYEDIKFYRPPFEKQVSVGLSAHAELTMPVFSVNIGMGHNFVCPKGEKSFYQSLTLKTFVSRHIYIYVGYRLGAFKDPQNLMLGVGVRY